MEVKNIHILKKMENLHFEFTDSRGTKEKEQQQQR